MDSSFQSFGLLCIVFIFIGSFALSGCEDPGSVGADLGGPGAEVVTDTVIIDGMQAINPNSYSGDLTYFSAGQFDDPLFGSLTATGYIRPNLLLDDSVNTDAKMLMRMIFDNQQVYGDSLASQKYSIYEIDEPWRGRALKINDQLDIDTSNKLGEFTVQEKDSIDIDLSALAPAWVNRYYSFVNADTSTNVDSLYVREMFGLALVPEDNNKIIPINTRQTRFVIQDPEADTSAVSIDEAGYTLQRTSSNSFSQGAVPLHSTFESILTFSDLGIDQLEVQTSGLSRAELILYEDKTIMEQSLQSAPFSVLRPRETTVYLQMADPEGIPDNIDPGAPLDNVAKVQGVYSESEGTYRFDITDLIGNKLNDRLPEDQEFFVTFPNDGVVKSSLIYTASDQAPVGKKPKIVITFLKNSSR